GRVLLLTTPLDGQWGTLPRTNFYLPLVQSMVRRLAAAGLDDRNVIAGQEIVATFKETLVGKAMMELPDGAVEPADVAAAADRAEVHYANTQQPGIYTLRVPLKSGPRAMP